MQQSLGVNLFAQRYAQLVTVFTNLYMTHPDAEVWPPEHRAMLARCMATKVAYGTSYDDVTELLLRRLNEWRGATDSASEGDSSN